MPDGAVYCLEGQSTVRPDTERLAAIANRFLATRCLHTAKIERLSHNGAMEHEITGWVEERNCWGVRVGCRWVPWAIGAAPRPWDGEYARGELDDEGYAVAVEVRACRPVVPNPN